MAVYGDKNARKVDKEENLKSKSYQLVRCEQGVRFAIVVFHLLYGVRTQNACKLTINEPLLQKWIDMTKGLCRISAIEINFKSGLGLLGGYAGVVVALALAIPIFLSFSKASVASPLPNHFIVLLDGSGSMQTDYSRTWWNPGWGRLNSVEKSQKIQKIVSLVLDKVPPGFPSFSSNDFLSFAFFSLEWNQPSYAIEQMFIVPKDMHLSQGLPEKSGLFWNSEWPVREPFHGHSPIVAATNAIFPYLGRSVIERPKNSFVGRTVLVRITDGRYNSRSNAADEFSAILATTIERNLERPINYDRYSVETTSVDELLTIGKHHERCALTIGTGRWRCGAEAIDQIKAFSDPKKKGRGLLVSFLEIAPRHPSLETLSALTSSAPVLHREARDNKVYWIVDEINKFVVHGWRSKNKKLEILPRKPVQFFLGSGERPTHIADCTFANSEGSDLRFPVDCGEGRSLPALEASSLYEFNKNAFEEVKGFFQIEYEVRFPGENPIYPLTYLVTQNLDLDLSTRPGRDEQYHDSVRIPGLGWPIPGIARSNWTKISDDELIAAAHGGILTARRLAERWNGNPDDNWFIGSLATIIAAFLCTLTWFGWPGGRRLYWRIAEPPEEAASFTVDFNQPKYLPAQIGEVVLERKRRPLRIGVLWHWTRLKLKLPGDRVLFEASGSGKEKYDLKWENDTPGVWIAVRGQKEHEDMRAVGGSRYPLLFDAEKLRDLSLPNPEAAMASLRGLLSYSVETSHSGEVQRRRRMDLEIIPEKADFKWNKVHLCETLTQENSDHPELVEDFGVGEPLPLVRYTLSNAVRHEFSQPARGSWSVQARSLPEGKILDAGEFLFSFDEAGTIPKKSTVDYSLGKDEVLDLNLIANLETLGNPVEPRCYDIRILGDDDKTLDEFVFTLLRSNRRTDLELQLIDGRENAIKTYSEAAATAEIETHDLREPLIEVHSESQLGTVPIVGLVLKNRCPIGPGYADWRFQVTDIEGSKKLDCPEHAISIEDTVGRPKRSGDLPDGSEPEELRVALNPADLRFLQRDAELVLGFRIECDKFPDGSECDDGREAKMENLAWCFQVRLSLRDVPPRRVLAIDFGTSAIAIAHAIGDREGEIQRLPIASRITENKNNLLSQCIEESPNLLSADANLGQKQVSEDNPEPEIFTVDDPRYLVLPANLHTVVETMGIRDRNFFPSLKMLLVHNYGILPINPRRYPYLNQDGYRETKLRPPLADVLRGVFNRLREEFAHPILKERFLDYGYLVATHPNTYTAVERAWYRDILVMAFEGMSEEHRLYQENIHLLSESDAVLNYYLLNAAYHRRCDPNSIPEHEMVLIWDIGAGTLDMTLARVERSRDSKGTLGAPRIEILDRYGVEIAGNKLTECIARDLDDWLSENLDEPYICPIVEQPDQGLPEGYSAHDLYNLMLVLRNQIEMSKRAVSADPQSPVDIQILGTAYGEEHGSLISTSKEDKGSYKKRGLVVDEKGNVYWRRTNDGRYVKAFRERVAKAEVEVFLGRPPAHLVDTVIVSGRTALWPNLVETLKETLPGVKTWVQFARDPEILKSAVTEGAVISQTRWRKNIVIKAPPVFGEYVVRYERNGKEDWHEAVLPNGVDLDVNMPNANHCEIGIRQSTLRFKSLFQFEKAEFHGDILILNLRSDPENGEFACEIRDASNNLRIITHETAGQWRKKDQVEIWPLTRPRLPGCTPEQIAGALMELNR